MGNENCLLNCVEQSASFAKDQQNTEYSKEELEKLEHIDWSDFYLESLLVEDQIPIIANLYITHERTLIFWPFFADHNNKW